MRHATKAAIGLLFALAFALASPAKAPANKAVYLRCMGTYKKARLCKVIAKGTLKMGFTEAEVEMAWGKPDHIYTVIMQRTGIFGTRGTSHVQWEYGTQGQDVYFTGGKVTRYDVPDVSK